ncbi:MULTISPECIES: DUF4190 domain-containing protein [Nocardiaceae]|uniref:DUF4190 domain-containing protein n=1 Tax=Rhodococcoides kroppenstedtii TaxID=293050 RepID=A0ABS7NY25_9NOCA|nr:MULTISPECIES: DUF4190 domain-containing protein [Rhodococcus]AMY21256.1 hypothetical protein A3Q40_03908 [Rhodococcus sp. PBTS 1]MBY6312926.1 DUF4190 domain-containing protein [Rhodococcus kroppenstedtii]MBY6322920.1 DUF4190 domain-containing protein [Rhodococcus kroppenstedtii]MBY6401647.1 DUF4190 domain-containing protein [Rhodococcus kroppenstedtii]
MTGPQYPGQPGPDDTPRDPGQYPPPGQYGQTPQGGQYGQTPQGGQYGSTPQGGQYPPPPGGQYEAAPQYAGGYQQQPPASPKNGMGIAALIVGILALLTSFTIFGGILLGIAAVILGIIGRSRVKKLVATNKGMATAGIVLGVLSIVVAAALTFFGFRLFEEVGGRDLLECVNNAGGDQAQIEQCQKDFTSNFEESLSVTITPSP